jgi:hypothetical protein
MIALALLLLASDDHGWTKNGIYYLDYSHAWEDEVEQPQDVYDARSGKVVATLSGKKLDAWLKKNPLAEGDQPGGVSIDVRTSSDNAQGAWKGGRWTSASAQTIAYVVKSGNTEWTALTYAGPCLSTEVIWNAKGTRFLLDVQTERGGMRMPATHHFVFGPGRGPRIAIAYSAGDSARAEKLASEVEKKAAPLVVSEMQKGSNAKGAGRLLATAANAEQAAKLASLLNLEADPRPMSAEQRAGYGADIVIDLIQKPL